MKIENILQRFNCISFLFKPPCCHQDISFRYLSFLELYDFKVSVENHDFSETEKKGGSYDAIK